MDWASQQDSNSQISSDQHGFHAYSYYDDHEEGVENQFDQTSKINQNQKEEITPQYLFQLSEENITCQICCKYALDAVICSNDKCKKLFCTHCVNSTKKSVQNKCPFCRTEPFQFVISPHARAINKMKLTCSLCKENYILEQELKHYKKECQFFLKAECHYCNERFLKSQMVKHTKQIHPQRIDQLLESIINSSPIFDHQELLNKNKLYFQKIGKMPHLGTSGKFYCGGRLQTKCTCCNGFCGPTNGENCVECMKLDIKRLGLAKGYLLNSGGRVCWKKGEDYICGLMIYYENSACKQGNMCGSCKNMKKNIKRYYELI